MADEAMIKMTADAHQAIAEMDRVEKANEKLEKQLHQQSVTSRQLARAEEKRLREAEKLTRDNETALERYNRRQKELNDHHAAGRINVETMNRALAKERDLLRGISSGTDNIGAAWSGAASSLGKFSVGVGAAMTAVELLNTEMEHTVKLGEEIRKNAISGANAMENLRANFVEDNSVGFADLDKLVSGISGRTGVAQEGVALAMTQAASSQGAATNAQMADAVEQSLMFTKDPGNASALSGAALDFLKFGQSRDTAAIMGFLTRGVAASHVKSAGGFGQAAVPVVSAGMGAGLSPEQSVELFTTWSQLAADSTGEKSKTGSLNFLDRLSGSDMLSGKAMDRISQLQASPELRSEFLKKNPFGAEESVVVNEILSNSDRFRAAFGKAVDVVPGLGGASDAANRAAFFERAAQVQGAGTAPGAIRAAAMRGDANVQAMQAAEAGRGGAVSQIRSLMHQGLDEVNMVGPDQFKIWGAGDWSVKELTKKRFDRAQSLGEDVEMARQQAVYGLLQARDAKSLLGGVSPEHQKLLTKQIEAINKLADEVKRQGELQARRDADANREVRNNRPAPMNPVLLNNAPR